MKCKTCNVAVSPKFVAAISENKCPACGKRMMSEIHYKRIFHVAEQIGNLGFDNDIVIGIAAAIASKFTLVPKDLALEQDENGNIEMELDEEEPEPRPIKRIKSSAKPLQNPKGMSPQAARRINSLREMVEDDEDTEVSPEEEMAIISEWGLDKAPKNNVAVSPGSSYIDSDIMSVMNDMPIGGDGPSQNILPAGSGSSTAAAKHAELLSRAAAAKNNSNHVKVRRVDP